MSPQNEQPNTSQENDDQVPSDHFLYIDPETRRKVDARTKAAIAATAAQRARKGLIRSDHLPKPQ